MSILKQRVLELEKALTEINEQSVRHKEGSKSKPSLYSDLDIIRRKSNQVLNLKTK